MGVGYMIHCDCNRDDEEEFDLGVGLLFPHFYQETVKKIKDGEYGEEAKNIMKYIPFATVDISSELYFCEKCGHLESDSPMDFYVPKDIEKYKKKTIGRWSAADPKDDRNLDEADEIPYWLPDSDDEDSDFVLIKKGEHFCPKCKNKLKEVSLDELENTNCPKCGKKFELMMGTLWD